MKPGMNEHDLAEARRLALDAWAHGGVTMQQAVIRALVSVIVRRLAVNIRLLDAMQARVEQLKVAGRYTAADFLPILDRLAGLAPVDPGEFRKQWEGDWPTGS